MNLPNFTLNQLPISQLFKKQGITDFKSACEFIRALPFGRISNRNNLKLVISERKGTSSSKHGLLALLAEENDHFEIELIAGIFLMNQETHLELEDFFKNKPYISLPEMHCYFRYEKQRYDFTEEANKMQLIEKRIVREQRIEPHQVGDWKMKIHQEYFKAWLLRNTDVKFTFQEIWNQREECIHQLMQ